LLGCNGHTKESLNEEGKRLSRQGNYNGHIVHYKNALEKDPKYLAARFNLALAYLETGKLDQAERELRKVLLQDPYDLRSACILDGSQFQDKPDVAIPLLKAYLERHPTDATPWNSWPSRRASRGCQAVRS
jgi:tetratricopeptide (TPR) repeat protein